MNPTANESLYFHMENSNNPQKIDILMKKNCQDFLKTFILCMFLCEFHFQTQILWEESI